MEHLWLMGDMDGYNPKVKNAASSFMHSREEVMDVSQARAHLRTLRPYESTKRDEELRPLRPPDMSQYIWSCMEVVVKIISGISGAE